MSARAADIPQGRERRADAQNRFSEGRSGDPPGRRVAARTANLFFRRRKRDGRIILSYSSCVTLNVDFDREEDGRWIAVVESIPGCHVYGKTRQEALTKVEALALHAIAEKLEDGEVTAEEAANVTFVVSAAA
jgi:predicted RNase H-like HicB family nuclease